VISSKVYRIPNCAKLHLDTATFGCSVEKQAWGRTFPAGQLGDNEYIFWQSRNVAAAKSVSSFVR